MKKQYANAYLTVKVFDKGRNLKRSYSFEELEDIFLATPFNVMPITLNAYKNEFFNDIEQAGNITVGYLTGYNPETKEFDVMIIEKCADRISAYKNPIIYPRVKLSKEGYIDRVLGLDICEAQYYSAIYK